MSIDNYINSTFSSSLKSKFVPIPNRVTLKKFSHISVFKRKEPSLGINFLSSQSKKMLKESIEQNTANPFFSLIDQFKTQTDPSYCGLTNLVIILNTLNIDPKEKWKGIWRWNDEERVKCCNIENVKDYGMTLPEFATLLKCNGVYSKVYRPNNEQFNSIPNMKSINIKEQLKNLNDDITENAYTCIKHRQNCLNKKSNLIPFNVASIEFLRLCTLASTKFDNFIVMCTLGRAALNQTGDGHFTPISAYHKFSDMGLLLDSARFKYNSRWYKMENIYSSLMKKDSFTQRARGFLLINRNGIEKRDIQIIRDIDLQRLKLKIKDNKFAIVDNDRSYLINKLFKTKTILAKRILNNQIELVWNEIIKGYYSNKRFKELTDLIYMFDKSTFISNLLYCLLKFK